MNDIQKLQNMLENEFLPDLEVTIDELFAEIDKAKNATKAQKDELEELREMRTECFAIIEEIKKDELPLEEATELLAELVELKVDDI